MIDLTSTMQGVLREAGFTIRLISLDRSPVICFEDDTLIGFACTFDDPSSLLARWKSTETSLLKRHAGSLRAAGEKAWNVYCVFLCALAGDSVQSRQVRWIEEDLERTRKITASGLASREDLVRALLPLLPLQYQPELEPENVTQRLERRVRSIAPKASAIVLDASVSPAEVVRLLGEPV